MTLAFEASQPPQIFQLPLLPTSPVCLPRHRLYMYLPAQLQQGTPQAFCAVDLWHRHNTAMHPADRYLLWGQPPDPNSRGGTGTRNETCPGLMLQGWGVLREPRHRVPTQTWGTAGSSTQQHCREAALASRPSHPTLKPPSSRARKGCLLCDLQTASSREQAIPWQVGGDLLQ